METPIKNHLVIGKETTFGTAVTPAVTIPVLPEGGMTTDPQRAFLQHMRSQLAKYFTAVNGANVHAGDYKADFLFDVIGHIFRSAIGDPTSALASGESIVYEHDFTEAVTKPSYTAEQKIGALTRRFAGVIFPSFKIVIEPGNPAIQVEFTAIGQSNATATPVTPSPSTQKVFTFEHAAISIDNTAVNEVRKIEIEYKNNGEMIPTIRSSRDPYGFVIGGSELDITLELLLESGQVDEYTDFINNTAKRIDVDLTGPSVGVASNYALNVGVPLVHYKTGEATFIDQGAVILPITASAVSESGSIFDQFKLTNLESDY